MAKKDSEKTKKESEQEESEDSEEKEESLEEFVESEHTPKSSRRPINITLSADERPSSNSSWVEMPEESLEDSLRDQPAKKKDEEKEEVYHTRQEQDEEKQNVYDTGQPNLRDRNAVIETRRVTETGVMESLRVQRGSRTVGMIQAPEFQQTPQDDVFEESRKIYRVRDAPDKADEMSQFRETAEDITRKYK